MTRKQAIAANPSVSEALASAAVKAAIDIGGATAKLEDSALAAVNIHSKAMMKAATYDVAAILKADATIKVAGETEREIMLARGLDMVEQRPAYTDSGRTAKQDTYLMAFAWAFMDAREKGGVTFEKKADGTRKTDAYTRTRTGEMAVMLQATQYASLLTEKAPLTVKVATHVKGKDGKVSVKMVPLKLDSKDKALAFLREPGNFRNTIMRARDIRRAAGYGGEERSKGARPIKAADAGKTAKELFSRMDVQGLLNVQEELFRMTRPHIIAANVGYWEGHAATYAQALVKAVTESTESAGAKEGSTLMQALAARGSQAPSVLATELGGKPRAEQSPKRKSRQTAQPQTTQAGTVADAHAETANRQRKGRKAA